MNEQKLQSEIEQLKQRCEKAEWIVERAIKEEIPELKFQRDHLSKAVDELLKQRNDAEQRCLDLQKKLEEIGAV